MPDRFKINRPISNALLTFIQSHPRVVSATRSNAGTRQETTLVILDAVYTAEQIENAVTRLIRDRQSELIDQAIAADIASKPKEYEVL